MDASPLRTERRGHVAVLTLNRPEHRNTVTYAVLDALIAALDAADRDDEVRAIVLTGAGDFFSAGTDLSARDGYAADGSDFKPLRGGDRDVGGELAIRMFDSTTPLIAAFNGTAVGIGVTMSLPMDIRIASTEARFGLPFTRRGIVPESCASWFLPQAGRHRPGRRLGRHRPDLPGVGGAGCGPGLRAGRAGTGARPRAGDRRRHRVDVLAGGGGARPPDAVAGPVRRAPDGGEPARVGGAARPRRLRGRPRGDPGVPREAAGAVRLPPERGPARLLPVVDDPAVRRVERQTPSAPRVSSSSPARTHRRRNSR